MNKKKLLIIGSSDLALLICHHAEMYCNKEVVGFIDDYITPQTIKNGKPILGGIQDVEGLFSHNIFDELMVGIGYKHFAFRQKAFELFINKIPFTNIIHPSTSIDTTATLGVGNFILPNCTLDMNAKLADNILLNVGSTIAHDSSIDSHTFLSPRVAVAGFVKIGKCCNLGINCTIIDNITIADHTQIGAGAVVTKNIEQAGLYVGVPAKKIK